MRIFFRVSYRIGVRQYTQVFGDAESAHAFASRIRVERCGREVSVKQYSEL